MCAFLKRQRMSLHCLAFLFFMQIFALVPPSQLLYEWWPSLIPYWISNYSLLYFGTFKKRVIALSIPCETCKTAQMIWLTKFLMTKLNYCLRMNEDTSVNPGLVLLGDAGNAWNRGRVLIYYQVDGHFNIEIYRIKAFQNVWKITALVLVICKITFSLKSVRIS